MDQSYLERNAASRERLWAVVRGLTDENLGRAMAGGWTVASTLAHLAFADRQIQGWLAEWERDGVCDSAALQEWNRAAMERLGGQNEERLPEWLGADPRRVVDEVVAAAESIDAAIARLSPELTAAILATSLFGRRRPWVLDRSIHRDEHLDAIENAIRS